MLTTTLRTKINHRSDRCMVVCTLQGIFLQCFVYILYKMYARGILHLSNGSKFLIGGMRKRGMHTSSLAAMDRLDNCGLALSEAGAASGEMSKET
jgi:hypothetical protein